MQRDKNRSPATDLLEAQRKLLHRLRATRSKWREASEMGSLDALDTAWSKTVWADTAGPAEDPDLPRDRAG
jgi:hypothetical protein